MKINNIIVISDTHCGCKLGLCPPDFKIKLDGGGSYKMSRLQKKLWEMWEHFWGEWVPKVTKGEPFVLVHNGDAIDGVHHNSTTQITHNLTDQIRIAKAVLEPVVKKAYRFYHIRGTEAHVGKSAQEEEMLAELLEAVPDEDGNYARWDMWLRIHQALVHFTHHIGNTSSASYEGTAPYKELVEMYNEAGRWHDEPPDVVVRSHRHRQNEARVPTHRGYGISLVTPGWQLRTPFSFRVGLGRTSTPQIGGYLIRTGDEDGVYTRFKVWKIERSKEECV